MHFVQGGATRVTSNLKQRNSGIFPSTSRLYTHSVRDSVPSRRSVPCIVMRGDNSLRIHPLRYPIGGHNRRLILN